MVEKGWYVFFVWFCNGYLMLWGVFVVIVEWYDNEVSLFIVIV